MSRASEMRAAVVRLGGVRPPSFTFEYVYALRHHAYDTRMNASICPSQVGQSHAITHDNRSKDHDIIGSKVDDLEHD